MTDQYTTTSSMPQACADGVSLLETLAREDPIHPIARTQLETFRSAHPEIRAELFATPSPMGRSVDYDLVIESAAGAIGLQWRPRNGIPWTVKYAENRTAGTILSIGDIRIEVQDALLLLRLTQDGPSGVLQKLLRYTLIKHVIRESPPPVSEIELQAAADRFRKNRGLLDAEATRRWLKEVGLTPQAMEKFLAQLVQVGKIKKRVTRGKLKPFFEAHSTEFDLLRILIVETPHIAAADDIAAAARQGALQTVVQRAFEYWQNDRGEFTTRLINKRAYELSAVPYMTASAGTLIGPVSDRGVYRVTQVLQRTSAVFDAETRAIVEGRLFDAWLEERGQAVDVRWYF